MIGDFLATPFVLVMFVCAYIASTLSGKIYIIAEVEEDDEQ